MVTVIVFVDQHNRVPARQRTHGRFQHTHNGVMLAGNAPKVLHSLNHSSYSRETNVLTVKNMFVFRDKRRATENLIEKFARKSRKTSPARELTNDRLLPLCFDTVFVLVSATRVVGTIRVRWCLIPRAAPKLCVLFALSVASLGSISRF